MEMMELIRAFFESFIQITETVFRQGFPCLFWRLTGLYCPGCGGTRAVFALLGGDVLLSLKYHPLVVYGAAVLLAELVSWLTARKLKTPRYYLGHEMMFIGIGVAIILINWIFKNYMLVVRGIDLLPSL